MTEKLVIIGGVAGGATAAARARRLNEHADIILFERGEHTSFANCGLPYYIGNVIKKRNYLLVTTPEEFKKRYNIDIRTCSNVIAIDRKNKQVEVNNTKTGEVYRQDYNKIILSPGAEPIKPPIDGIESDRIFTLRNIPDTDRIKAFVDANITESAVIVGGGFIGIEMAENLAHRGVKITILEMLDQVMAPMDFEMASIIHAHLKEKGVRLELENGVKGFKQNGNSLTVMTANGNTIECDMAILSIGVKPENKLAEDAGLAMGERGGIKVDAYMKTSDPDILAAGDAVEVKDFVTGQPAMIPLAGPANKQGRITADNAMGRKSDFRGTLGTSIVKIFDLTAACTGLNEKILKQKNIPYQKSYTNSPSHATYYPGANSMSVKLLFAPENGRILGAQIIGVDGVDKRIDVIATAIYGSMTVYDLEALELAYAPPFSSAKDPVNMAGFVAANMLKGDVKTVFWNELDELDRDEFVLIDLRTKKEIEELGDIEGSIHIPIDNLREKMEELDRKKTYILYCAVGMRGYVGYRILSQNGFKAENLSGGYELYKYINNDK